MRHPVWCKPRLLSRAQKHWQQFFLPWLTQNWFRVTSEPRTPSKNGTLPACRILLRGRIIWKKNLYCNSWTKPPPCQLYYNFFYQLILQFHYSNLHLPNRHGAQRVLHHSQTHSKNIESYCLSSSFTLLLLSQWSLTPRGREAGMVYYRISHFQLLSFSPKQIETNQGLRTGNICFGSD